jgi:hypothetical protein
MWRSEQRTRHLVLLRTWKVLSVLVVAGVAGYVSYWHIHDLALDVGEGQVQAKLLPLSVDGMMLAATINGVQRRQAGLNIGLGSWAAELLGVAVSTAANIAAAEPTPQARVFAMWAPVALFISLGLLFSNAHAPADPNQALDPEPEPTSPQQSARTNGTRPSGGRVEELYPLACAIRREHGGPLTRQALKDGLSKSDETAGTATLVALQKRVNEGDGQ